MTRIEIRRRALHAAAAASFTLGLLACGDSVIIAIETGNTAGGGIDTPEPMPTVDPPDPPDPIDPPDAAVADAADPDPADAGGDAGYICNPETPEYADCCAEHNWDWNAGCMAWGPPMPPSMGIA